MDEQTEVFGCSLSAAELADRRGAWEAVVAARVDGVRNEGGFRVRFRGDSGVSESLRALVAAEQECCGWASWEVVDEGDCSVLEVSGPPGRIGALATAFGI
jgi:hypothetical protein